MTVVPLPETPPKGFLYYGKTIHMGVPSVCFLDPDAEPSDPEMPESFKWFCAVPADIADRVIGCVQRCHVCGKQQSELHRICHPDWHLTVEAEQEAEESGSPHDITWSGR